MLLSRTSRSIRNVERAVRITVWLFQLKCSRISKIGRGKGKKPSWKAKNRVQRKGGVKVYNDNKLANINGMMKNQMNIDTIDINLHEELTYTSG